MFIGEVAFTSRASLVQREVAPQGDGGIVRGKKNLDTTDNPPPPTAEPPWHKGALVRCHFVISNPPTNQNLALKIKSKKILKNLLTNRNECAIIANVPRKSELFAGLSFDYHAHPSLLIGVSNFDLSVSLIGAQTRRAGACSRRNNRQTVHFRRHQGTALQGTIRANFVCANTPININL